MTEQSQAIGILTQVGIDVSDLSRAEAFYSANCWGSSVSLPMTTT